MQDSCIICFSSAVNKEGSWMQKYYDDPKFKERNSTVRAAEVNRLCDNCRKLDPPPSSCPHVATPPQQDPRREEFVKTFMSDPGAEDEDAFMQEYMGIPMDQQVALFRKPDLDHILLNPLSRVSVSTIERRFVDPQAATVMHFVDPNGGTNKWADGKKAFSSHMGIASVLLHCPLPNHVTVLGKLSFPTNNPDQMNAVVQAYCQRITEHAFFRRARHILAVETNFGGPFTANIYLQRFRHHLPQITDISDPVMGHGAVTNRDNKSTAGLFLTADVRGGRIHLLNHAETFERYAMDLMPNATTTQAVLDEKIKNGRTLSETDRLNAAEKIMLQEFKHLRSRKGNYTAKGKDKNDDLVMSIMMAGYWIRNHHEQRSAAVRHHEFMHVV